MTYVLILILSLSPNSHPRSHLEVEKISFSTKEKCNSAAVRALRVSYVKSAFCLEK